MHSWLEHGPNNTKVAGSNTVWAIVSCAVLKKKKLEGRRDENVEGENKSLLE